MPTLSLAQYSIFIDDLAVSWAKFIGEYNNYSQYIILTDEVCHKYCLQVFYQNANDTQQFPCIVVRTGEVYKNIGTCKQIWSELARLKADRNTLLINLGGGVIGDMGGFAAATYKRGIDFVQIPTTLLAQTDASVGGKLGIDFEGVKNMIGLFASPKAVFIDPIFLQTLPPPQLYSGLAEMFKHALLSNREHWNDLKSKKYLHLSTKEWQDLLCQSVNIKRQVVEKDPKEKGLRQILNLGHTAGHAFESWSLEKRVPPLLHGEAVAWGMVLALQLSHQLLGFPKSDLQVISRFFKKTYPSFKLPASEKDAFFKYMYQDKKNVQQSICFVLLQCIGHPVYGVEIKENTIWAAMKTVGLIHEL